MSEAGDKISDVANDAKDKAGDVWEDVKDKFSSNEENNNEGKKTVLVRILKEIFK